MLHPLWDGPALPKVTKGSKNRIFVPRQPVVTRRLYFTDSSGCCSVHNGMAEMIPVEPGQGNACAGKVNQHFNFSFVAFPYLLFNLN